MDQETHNHLTAPPLPRPPPLTQAATTYLQLTHHGFQPLVVPSDDAFLAVHVGALEEGWTFFQPLPEM